MSAAKPLLKKEARQVFAGDGELAALMRAHDWAKTPLGPVENWPQSLRTTVHILLTSRYAMWMGWGPELTFLYNDSYAQMTLGKKHPWALGRPANEVWREIWSDIGPRIEKVLETGQATWDEALLLFLERSGFSEETYHTFSYSPLVDDDGVIAGMLCVVTEETERVIGERQLATLRLLASELTTSIAEPEVYAAIRRSLGQNRRDLPFTLTYIFSHDGGAARVVCSTGLESSDIAALEKIEWEKQSSPWPIAEVMRENKAVLVGDLDSHLQSLPTGAWNRATTQAFVVPIARQGQDRPAGIFISGVNPYRQVTSAYSGFVDLLAGQIAAAFANARAYEEERKHVEALAEIDRAKTVFFSNVSHEFRTPLTLMMSPLHELLTEFPLAGEERDRIAFAYRNSVRLQRLVNNLLDFSRIEARKAQAQYKQVDIGGLTADLASGFRSVFEKAGLSFDVRLSPPQEPVFVDPEMWEKIVLNLLSNAFKFTIQGSVSLDLVESGGFVELAIRDTGVGIPEQELPNLFKRFYRVRGTAGRSYEGTGIGLALVQELVKLHDGEIAVESEPGKGTCFTVSIPTGSRHSESASEGKIAESAASPARAESFVNEAFGWLLQVDPGFLPMEAPPPNPAVETPRRSRPRILIADDNADMRAYMSRLLGREFDIEAVNDGQRALDAIRSNPPALVISDIMMPAMDGLALLRALRSDPATETVPVMLLSARAGEEERVEGLEAGADDYLVKPFGGRELVARVRAQVMLAQVRRESVERDRVLRAEAERERRRLEELLALAPAAIGLLTGPDHRWTYVNEDYIRLTGRSSQADFIGKTILESLPEIETQVFIGLLNEVYCTGKPYFGREMKTVLNRSAKGLPDESYWDFVYQPVRNVEGTVEGILIHAVEVTDKVTARDIVQENAQRLLLAQTAAQIGTWEWDPARDSRVLSPELHRIFGTEAEDPDHAQKWAGRVHPEDWSKVQQCMTEAAGTGVMDFEYRYLHPHHGLRWFYCKGQRFRQETRMFGIVQDITGRKETEKALAESEERYRTVAETASDAIVSIDEDSTVLFANSATARVFGYKPEEIVGKNLTMLMPDHMRRLHAAGVQRYIASGKRQLDWDATELPGLHRDGRELPLELSFGEYTQGGKHYFTGFARDITQRKIAEKALRESEQKLRVVTEATPIMIWMAGPDKLCYYFNKSWLDFVGRTLEKEMGNGWAENVHLDDFDRCLQIYVNSFDARQPFEMEYRLRHHSGEYRWILDHGVPRFAPDGTFEGYVGGCLDIHGQKEADEKARIATDALRKGEERYRALVTATSDAIYRMSLDWTQMLYLDGQDFIQDTREPSSGWIQTYIHPDDQARLLARIHESVRTKSIFELEHRVIRKDGTLGWIFSRAIPLLQSDGAIREWFGTATDITERVRAEEEARDQRNRFRLAAEVAQIGYWFCNLPFDKLQWDDRVKEHFWLPPDADVDINLFYDRLHPEDRERARKAVEESIANRSPYDVEYRTISGTGEVKWIHAIGQTTYDRSGTPVCFDGVTIDVTALKRTEDALVKSEKLAVVGRMAATISHEINNPLEAVINLLYLIQTNVTDETARNYTRSALEELARVSHIVTHTLRFHRDTGGAQNEKLSSLLESAIGMYQGRISTSGIDVIRDYADSRTVRCFPSELRQVFTNLFGNAFDATRSGGRIILRTRDASDRRTGDRGVRVTIADTGHGMSADTQRRIFEPFFTTKGTSGTGLGLWISKGILDRHHARIRVRSRAGLGTVFSSFFPLASDSEAQQPSFQGDDSVSS